MVKSLWLTRVSTFSPPQQVRSVCQYNSLAHYLLYAEGWPMPIFTRRPRGRPCACLALSYRSPPSGSSREMQLFITIGRVPSVEAAGISPLDITECQICDWILAPCTVTQTSKAPTSLPGVPTQIIPKSAYIFVDCTQSSIILEYDHTNLASRMRHACRMQSAAWHPQRIWDYRWPVHVNNLLHDHVALGTHTMAASLCHCTSRRRA